MGQRPSVEEVKEDVEGVALVLQNRLDTFLLRIRENRGPEGADNKKEIAGGRTALRISEIQVATSLGVDANISAGINSFFEAASGAVSGQEGNAPKAAAVEGAQSMLSGAISSLLGVSGGQAQEKQGFVVLFLNNAFVRVDYFAYSYSVSAKGWGQEANASGLCYMADLAVLDPSDIEPAEIDFLLSRALHFKGDPSDDLNQLNKLKIALTNASVLSRSLQDDKLDFADVERIAQDLTVAQRAIDEAFAGLEDVPDRNSPIPGISFFGTPLEPGDDRTRNIVQVRGPGALGFGYEGEDAEVTIENVTDDDLLFYMTFEPSTNFAAVGSTFNEQTVRSKDAATFKVQVGAKFGSDLEAGKVWYAGDIVFLSTTEQFTLRKVGRIPVQYEIPGVATERENLLKFAARSNSTLLTTDPWKPVPIDEPVFATA